MDRVEIARQTAAALHAAAVARGEDPRHPYAFALAEALRQDLDVETAAVGAAVLNGGRASYVARDHLIIHEDVGTAFDRAFLVAHELGHTALGDALVESGDERTSNAGGPLHIDAARSAEPSPVGVDRVLDYGRRQRREVQMDLFAREFLLPRAVVRALHLEDGLSASAIAARFDAPFDIVAQQLFDALLLPEATPDETRGEAAEGRSEPPHVDQPLTARQADAAAHRGVAFLLEAGPGTGKTRTLVGRVQGLLADGVDPRRILLLTFSNKAAGEMADRIARRDRDAAAAMWIGTFHAFGLDLLRRFHTELGLPVDPRLMDRVEAAELLEAEFPRLGLTHYRNVYDPTQIVADMLNAISRAKDEVADAASYAALAGQMYARATTDDAREAAERAAEVARVYDTYEALKLRHGCVDFGDLVSLPVLLLEQNADVRTQLAAQYTHVLVDEYQDVNRASVRLLTALRPDGRDLWVVGDARQSVYRFRGASSYNMSRFGTTDFPGGVRRDLNRNYRSVEEVVDACADFAAGMTAGAGSERPTSDRGTVGHRPALALLTVAEQVPVALADQITAMRATGHAYRNQAVLCTGNERLAAFAEDLERLGVPVLFLGNLFERPEVRDLLALLSLVVDRRAMGLLRTACWPEFAMSMPDVAAVLQHLRVADETRAAGITLGVTTLRATSVPAAAADAAVTSSTGSSAQTATFKTGASTAVSSFPLAPPWLRDVDGVPGISEVGRVGLRALAEALEGFDAGASPWTVLATVLLDRTRIGARLAAPADVAGRTRAIAVWQLLNFLRAQPGAVGASARPISVLLDRVRRLVRLGDDRELRQLPAVAQGLDAVRLMTIHGAKGLEFGVVHVPGVTADTIPRAAAAPACPPPDGMVEGGAGDALVLARAAHAEEQECLFYVAMSRTADRLFLYAPTQNALGRRRALSPFLDRLGARLRREVITPLRSLPPDPASGDIAVTLDGGLRFSETQLALFESCPRRFFYTHVLRVGGRRTESAFMRLHEAVRGIVHEILATGAVDEARHGTVDEPVLAERLGVAFAIHGLADHGYAREFQTLGAAMLRYFLASRQGHAPEPVPELAITFGDDAVRVRPDDVLRRADGSRVVRRVRTGHLRSQEDKDVAAAALALATQQAFPDANVELLHLSDGAARPLTFSAVELRNRREKLAGIFAHIRAGHFPPKPSSRTCPGCPMFFVCGVTPPGAVGLGSTVGSS